MTGGIQERKDSGLEGFRTGRIQKGGIHDCRDKGKGDSGLEVFRTGGMQEKRYSGMQGYRKGGVLTAVIQDCRDTGKDV